jgi:hypothetical protein
VPTSRMSRVVLPLHLYAFIVCAETLCLFYFYVKKKEEEEENEDKEEEEEEKITFDMSQKQHYKTSFVSYPCNQH